VTQVGGAVEWETDRARFLGRGRTTANPMAIEGRALSGTTGAVLDPVAALRERVRLAPGAFVRVTFATGIATDRTTALALVRKYRDASAAARAFSMASTHVHITLQHPGLSDDQAMLCDRLASRVFGSDATGTSSDDLARNIFGQSNLWGRGISGDLPIVLVQIADASAIGLARQLLHAQEYWRVKYLRADLVILNDHPADYLDEVQEQLTNLVREPRWSGWVNKSGGMFLLRSTACWTPDSPSPLGRRPHRPARRPRRAGAAARSEGAVAVACADRSSSSSCGRRRRPRARDAAPTGHGKRDRRASRPTGASM
jgi:cyclic beta-1,2-glucan synthetase